MFPRLSIISRFDFQKLLLCGALTNVWWVRFQKNKIDCRQMRRSQCNDSIYIIFLIFNYGEKKSTAINRQITPGQADTPVWRPTLRWWTWKTSLQAHHAILTIKRRVYAWLAARMRASPSSPISTAGARPIWNYKLHVNIMQITRFS